MMKITAALAVVGAVPVLSLSLPPLIPKIPGVTEPLNGFWPPLPILQVPTPPLDSPPFTPSNIRPKKIGYFWTGAGDNQHADFLATYSLDDDTFGELIYITDVPTSGNSPHHLGVSRDGKTLIGGGLLSLLKTQVYCPYNLTVSLIVVINPNRILLTTSIPRTPTVLASLSPTVEF